MVVGERAPEDVCERAPENDGGRAPVVVGEREPVDCWILSTFLLLIARWSGVGRVLRRRMISSSEGSVTTLFTCGVLEIVAATGAVLSNVLIYLAIGAKKFDDWR